MSESMKQRRTKIVATLGPATDPPGVLARMIDAGLDVARLNFSHGRPEDHRRRARLLRRTAAARGQTVAILGDLQGPKIRIGPTPDDRPLHVRRGDPLMIITSGPPPEAGAWVPTPFRRLDRDARPGHRILLADGTIELAVARIAPGRVACRVLAGGVLRSRQGMNLPDIPLRTGVLTAKDLRDLDLAIALGVDWLALSFVRRPEDLRGLRARLRRKGSGIPIVAKIEKPEAVDRLEEIVREADALMVARGDLGVEIPYARVPGAQKRIIAAALGRGIPVITATQMLESMVSAPRPTRAEASDVANAVLDGTDAVMLSAETAVGKYPVAAVAAMDAIAREAEALTGVPGSTFQVPSDRHDRNVEPGTWNLELDAVAEAAVKAAGTVGARAIVVFTKSGRTALRVARWRPGCPVHALTPDPATPGRLALARGVEAFRMPVVRSTDALIESGVRILRRAGRLRAGDTVVVVGGIADLAGGANMMKIHKVSGF